MKYLKHSLKDQLDPSQIVDLNYIQQVSEVFLTQVNEEVINICFFRDLSLLQKNLEILWNLF